MQQEGMGQVSERQQRGECLLVRKQALFVVLV